MLSLAPGLRCHRDRLGQVVGQVVGIDGQIGPGGAAGAPAAILTGQEEQDADFGHGGEVGGGHGLSPLVDSVIVAARGGTPWLWCPFVHKP